MLILVGSLSKWLPCDPGGETQTAGRQCSPTSYALTAPWRLAYELTCELLTPPLGSDGEPPRPLVRTCQGSRFEARLPQRTKQHSRRLRAPPQAAQADPRLPYTSVRTTLPHPVRAGPRAFRPKVDEIDLLEIFHRRSQQQPGILDWLSI
jgi:hypothetical protein